MFATQLDSWSEKQETLGVSQGAVFAIIKQSPDGMTLFELVKELGWPVNRISGRVTELSNAMKIEPSGTRINPETKKAGMVWKAKE